MSDELDRRNATDDEERRIMREELHAALQASSSTPRHTFVDPPEDIEDLLPSAPSYGGLVVAVVVALVISIGTIAVGIGAFYSGIQVPRLPVEVAIGPWTILVSDQLPPKELIASALLGMVGVAAAAVSFEIIAALMSINPRRRVLGSYRRRARDLGSPGNPVRVTVLMPAHDEETSLPITLTALKQQTRQPDRVIVVADNCTDRTAQIAREMGYEAFLTAGNEHRKGGALNQALAWVLPDTDALDVILVMDADTSLGPQFIEVAAGRLESDAELSAVGGVFYGESGHGLIGQFQRNEYTRYSLQIRARKGRVFVLTGTATMFRADALLDVAAARGVFIPGETGRVYDTAALTEDNELTLALKSLGAMMTSPPQCTVTTELMPSWSHLWTQRKRWQRGALENLSAYGLTRATIRYWGQQIGIGYGFVALNSALLLMLITVLAIDEWIWFPLWAVIGLIFVTERVLTAWRGGWRARLLALLLFPELAYDVFLQIVFLKCLFDITFARRTAWGHVQHEAPVATP